MKIVQSSQARSVQQTWNKRALNTYIRDIKGIVIEVPANAFTLNINFTNENTLIKANCF